MQFIENTKKKIGKWVFQNELKTNKRLKEVCNLDVAKSVGILYDATSEEQIKQVKPFVDYFSTLKKDVKALGFVVNKQEDRYVGDLTDVETATLISKASGFLGTCADYLINTSEHLEDLGIPDKKLSHLVKLL